MISIDREEKEAHMNAVKRKMKILDLLKEKESIDVETLTSLFGISKVTVRGDLDDLHKKGLLIRTHGGAMLPETSAWSESSPIPSKNMKMKNMPSVKRLSLLLPLK